MRGLSFVCLLAIALLIPTMLFGNSLASETFGLGESVIIAESPTESPTLADECFGLCSPVSAKVNTAILEPSQAMPVQDGCVNGVCPNPIQKAAIVATGTVRTVASPVVSIVSQPYPVRSFVNTVVVNGVAVNDTQPGCNCPGCNCQNAMVVANRNEIVTVSQPTQVVYVRPVATMVSSSRNFVSKLPLIRRFRK